MTHPIRDRLTACRHDQFAGRQAVDGRGLRVPRLHHHRTIDDPPIALLIGDDAYHIATVPSRDRGQRDQRRIVREDRGEQHVHRQADTPARILGPDGDFYFVGRDVVDDRGLQADLPDEAVKQRRPEGIDRDLRRLSGFDPAEIDGVDPGPDLERAALSDRHQHIRRFARGGGATNCEAANVSFRRSVASANARLASSRATSWLA